MHNNNVLFLLAIEIFLEYALKNIYFFLKRMSQTEKNIRFSTERILLTTRINCFYLLKITKMNSITKNKFINITFIFKAFCKRDYQFNYISQNIYCFF